MDAITNPVVSAPMRWIAVLVLIGCAPRYHWVPYSDRGRACYATCMELRDSCLNATARDFGNPCGREAGNCLNACPDVTFVSDR